MSLYQAKKHGKYRLRTTFAISGVSLLFLHVLMPSLQGKGQ